MARLIAIVFIVLASSLSAQNAVPYFSYNNGLGFATPDSSYSLNLRFRMQNRAMMNTASDEDFQPGSFEARVRRLRLVLTGHVVNPKLTYYVQLSFSRGDMDWSVTDVTTQNLSPNVVRDAVIYYRPAKRLQLGFGQTKLPGNRQRVISSGSQQFFDRSIVNATFTPDRDFGFFANYTLHGSGKSLTILKAAVTSGEGRNSSLSNPGLAYTGRIEFLPLGAFTNGGDYLEGDVMREQKPKLSIAAGYMLNDLAVRTGGQLGKDLMGSKSFNLYMADLVFKYQGFCLSSEYIRRDASNPYVLGTDKKTRMIQTGDGINNQISYCFKSMWEVAGRYALVSPHHDILKDFNQAEQFVLGVTKYLNKHKVKTQFNLVYNRERNLAQQKNLNSYFSGVFQVELGI
jgi:phosphate-selective porin OprO/OprP